MTREEEIDALVVWMEEARGAVVAGLIKEKSQFTYPAYDYEVTLKARGSRSFRRYRVNRNILNAWNVRARFKFDLVLPNNDRVTEIATSFLQRTNLDLPAFVVHPLGGASSFGGAQVTVEEDPERWLAEVAFCGAFWAYTSKLDDVRSGDPGQARVHILRMFRDLETQRWYATVKIPLFGFLGSAEVASRQLHLRPILRNEYEEFGLVDTSSFAGASIRELPTHVLLASKEYTDQSQEEVYAQVFRLLLALRFLGFDPTGSERGLIALEPEWMASIFSLSPTYMRKVPEREPTEVSQDILEAVAELAVKLLPGGGVAAGTPKSIACRRFNSAFSRQQLADRLIDFVIALEATLLPGMDKGELSFRFQLNGANFLGGTPEDKAKTAGALKKAYDIRSRIVHGGKSVSSEDLKAAVDDAQELARRILLKCVQEGWPSADDFKALYFH